ncbi:MAG: invasion associated locus B family protein [Pseudomonadota bacterium]
MNDLIRSLSLALLFALSAPSLATAQETADGEAADEEVIDPLELSMGEDEGPAEDGPGSIYVLSEHTDWDIRCVRAAEGNDPCQLYQLLTDQADNPVAEINIFPLVGGETEAKAGATIVTPLETLLTAELGLQVDSGGVKKYPFSWCSAIGCFARLGFADEDIEAFKAGNVARVIIVPVTAPDQRVSLEISLAGFTAAFEQAEDIANAE